LHGLGGTKLVKHVLAIGTILLGCFRGGENKQERSVKRRVYEKTRGKE
jgi:hypothetical protein